MQRCSPNWDPTQEDGTHDSSYKQPTSKLQHFYIAWTVLFESEFYILESFLALQVSVQCSTTKP